MGRFTQDNRRLRIATPLGADELLLLELHGQERLSALFRFDVTLLSENKDVAFDEMVGGNVTCSILMNDGDERFLNGVVSRFSLVAVGRDFATYSAEVVPWLWFLTRTADCRIFQNKSVPEIVRQLFTEHGFSDYRLDVGDYPTRDYCVQYRETDYGFVARLLEEEGIAYFFEHENGKHTLVMVDKPTGHPACPVVDRVRYVHTRSESDYEDIVLSFTKEQIVQSGAFAHRDYNFEKPSVDLSATASGKDARAFELYDYPGTYQTQDDADRLARVRQEAEDAPRVVFRGSGYVRAFSAGHRFDLRDHPSRSMNAKYLLTHVRHVASEEGGYVPNAGEEPTLTYENEFECMPATTPFRPPRITPRPVVQGPQTAFVVGPAGEEIHTDKHGRVKVQFHWDREGKGDEKSSSWIRVSQNWAGKRWGAFFLPRVGQEVIVDFLEGDPDRPIITGRVYHAESMPPYDLPAEATKSTMKTNSSKGGAGFNEIRFEDKKGDEQIFVHAEKNQDVRVKENLYEWIGKERHRIVKEHEYVSVEAEQHVKVGTDAFVEVVKDRHVKIGGKQATEVAESFSCTVKGDVVEVFKANHSEQTTQNWYVKAMGVVIEATSGITLKCGGSAVVVDPAGVTLKGTQLVLDGSMVRIASGPGSPPTPGQAGSAVSPTVPKPPEEADLADPGAMAEVKAKQVETKSGKYGAVKLAPHKPEEAKQQGKKSWIEIELVDEEGNPVPGEDYEVTLPDGTTVARGTLDAKGFARVDGIDPGTCKVTFPKLDKDAWERA